MNFLNIYTYMFTNFTVQGHNVLRKIMFSQQKFGCKISFLIVYFFEEMAVYAFS